MPTEIHMLTVSETKSFKKQADKVWSQDERHEFIDWIAVNPNAGDVIPGAEGARKVRWSIAGKGKRGGVRVIYFNVNENEVLLFAVYAKSEKENMTPDEIGKA
jgi:mRNA-degrading endonuclease RelE of RelBE toxin-antitoxin system